MSSTPEQPALPDDTDPAVTELLNTDRELNDDEQRRLRTLAATGMAYVGRWVTGRARQTYAMASAEDFGECVFGHMNIDQRAAMVIADIYNCPQCNRLLKDRRSPVASSILLERARLRELWTEVEQAPESERDLALKRFRTALGL